MAGIAVPNPSLQNANLACVCACVPVRFWSEVRLHVITSHSELGDGKNWFKLFPGSVSPKFPQLSCGPFAQHSQLPLAVLSLHLI